MKTKTIIIALLMVLITGNCFAQNKLFDKFSEMEGVTSVFISKSMLQMMPGMKIQNGMDIGDFAGKLSGILILTSENQGIAKMMRTETAHFNNNPAYEILMKVKDDGSNVNFYVKKKSETLISELVMLVDEPDEFVIIQMNGNMTMEDIQKLTKKMK
jgi:hypothetical protein